MPRIYLHIESLGGTYTHDDRTAVRLQRLQSSASASPEKTADAEAKTSVHLPSHNRAAARPSLHVTFQAVESAGAEIGADLRHRRRRGDPRTDVVHVLHSPRI